MKGVLSRPEMIQAIVNGSKTQTRRVIKSTKDTEWLLNNDWSDDYIKDPANHLIDHCHYHIGETVYIKEAFTYVTRAEEDPWKYKAIKDGSFRRKPDGSPVTMCYKLDGYEISSDWENPCTMPAWAARYFIQITGVRAERLNQISSSDVTKEGFDNLVTFMLEWDKINGRRGYEWKTNCWVWVYEFQMV